MEVIDGRYTVVEATSSITRGVERTHGHRQWIAYVDVQSTIVGFLMVQQAVMPTNVLPAPHGNTMIPDRARLDREKEKSQSW